MICIMLNGKEKTLQTNATLKDALTEIDEHLKPFAVALNRHFVPQSQYSNVLLKEGDVVEIVTPMQGG